MKKILISLVLLLGCLPAFAQVQVTRDELPDFNSTNSTAVANNVLRQNQNAINSIGGYFNTNGLLTEANGGTGTNLSTAPNGSILVQNTGNVGIGTFGQGTAGYVLVSQGAGINPSWSPQSFQAFLTSGTWVAPTGVTKAYVTMIGAGGGGGSGGGSATGGNSRGAGGGGAGAVVFQVAYPVTPGNSYTVTIGAGGTGGVGTSGQVGNNGSTGGTTSFDAISIAPGVGGVGGQNGSAGTGGAGATITLNGAAGAAGVAGVGGGRGISGGNGGNGENSAGGAGGGGGGNIIAKGGTAGAAGQPGGNGEFGAGGSGSFGNVGGSGVGGSGGQGFILVQF